LGVVVGRMSDQDPEIEKDRRWFLRQSGRQKVQRVLAVILVAIMYGVCAYNVYSVHFDRDPAADQLRVSLMESLGPSVLLAVIWMLLSLWIANEQTLRPKLPPLARLRSINLYFGEHLDQTTSAYKFLRGYISLKGTSWNISWIGMSLILLLSLFYASIPGLTRLTVGDSSDGLERRAFMSFNECRVELGALMVNAFLMSALMYSVEVQYRKHIEYYKQWMHELTTFLMAREIKPEHQLDDDFDDELSYEPASPSEECANRYLPSNLYLSLKRRSNALGWMEIRSFLECEGKLFFGEQELPILWTLAMSMMITLFALYRVFFISGYALQSVLFNGVTVLAVICWASLIKMSRIAAEFEHLQSRQESMIEIQKFVMRCDETFGGPEDDGMDSDENKETDDSENDQEDKPLIAGRSLSLEMRWYSRNVGFVEDMLNVVKRKDICPKLFNAKLNAVLIPIIGGITVSGIVILLKCFAEILLF